MGSMGTQEEYQTKTTGQQGSGASSTGEEYTGGVLVPALKSGTWLGALACFAGLVS